ncbi:MAG: transposase, partial [Cytophagaceae bacterium]|nr:transposase [Cytophagaceae bacterium]
MGELLSELFFQTGEAVQALNLASTYSIDSFPVEVCHHIRINRSKIVKGEDYRWRFASKRTYFYGFKVHIIVTSEGIPVEYTFTTGRTHDLDGLRQMPLTLPKGSEIL